MRVDLDALASFSRMGDEGATRAADALESLTGESAHASLSRTAVVEADAVTGFLGDAETRVRVPFDGGLSGTAFVSFEASFASHVVDHLPAGGEPLPEVANILASGFVDAWADDAPDTIDVRPPERVDAPADADSCDAPEDYAFVFESRVGTASADGDCRVAVVPDVDPFLDYLAGDGQRLSMDSLAAFIRLTEDNARAVASHVGAMTGRDATVVDSRFEFVPVERVPTLLDEQSYSGAVFECDGAVEAVVAVLFDDAEAAVADPMLASDDPDPELAESAVAELGNVTASGFLDGWANHLDATIDVSTPSSVRDHGRAVLDTVAAAYGQHADAVAVLEAVVDVSDDATCRVCAFPSPADAGAVGGILDRLAEGEQ